MMYGFLFALLSSTVCSLKLNKGREFDTTDSVYDEACGDHYDQKCWKKVGHSVDLKLQLSTPETPEFETANEQGWFKQNPFEWVSDALSDLLPPSYDTNHIDVDQPKIMSVLDSISFGQGCPDRDHPKLAVCVHGLAKGLTTTPAHVNNFENNMMKLAQDAGAVGITRTRPDIFVDMHMGEDSVEKGEEMMKAIQATKFSIVPGLGSATMSEVKNTCWKSLQKKAHGVHPIEHTLNQYKSMGGCYQMLTDAEQQSGRKFDFVITMRADHWWVNESSEEFSAMEKDTKEYLVHSYGGGSVIPNKIQCAKSFFKRDHISMQTRAAFEFYGRIWSDDMVSETPRRPCEEMHRSEQVPQQMVNWMNHQNTTKDSCYAFKWR